MVDCRRRHARSGAAVREHEPRRRMVACRCWSSSRTTVSRRRRTPGTPSAAASTRAARPSGSQTWHLADDDPDFCRHVARAVATVRGDRTSRIPANSIVAAWGRTARETTCATTMRWRRSEPAIRWPARAPAGRRGPSARSRRATPAFLDEIRASEASPEARWTRRRHCTSSRATHTPDAAIAASPSSGRERAPIHQRALRQLLAIDTGSPAARGGPARPLWRRVSR